MRRLAEAFGANPVAEFVYAGRSAFEVNGIYGVSADPHRIDHILTFLGLRGADPPRHPALAAPGELRPALPGPRRGLPRQPARAGGAHPHPRRAPVGGGRGPVHRSPALDGRRHPARHPHRPPDRPDVGQPGRRPPPRPRRPGPGLLRLQRRGGGDLHLPRSGASHGRVLVIDLDLHDGDGTRALFADDPTVHTFSIHNAPWGPTDAVESTSISLGDGAEDEEYLATLARAPAAAVRPLPAVPGLLPGRLRPGRRRRPRQLAHQRRRHARARPLRGRPDPPSGPAADGGRCSPAATARSAWRYSARFFGWLLSGGQEMEVPSTGEITLARYRFLSKLVSPAQLTGAADDGRLRSDRGGPVRRGRPGRHRAALPRLLLAPRPGAGARAARHHGAAAGPGLPPPEPGARPGQPGRPDAPAVRRRRAARSCWPSCGRGGTSAPCPAGRCSASSGCCSRTPAPASAGAAAPPRAEAPRPRHAPGRGGDADPDLRPAEPGRAAVRPVPLPPGRPGGRRAAVPGARGRRPLRSLPPRRRRSPPGGRHPRRRPGAG